jgi:uncharacterized DUF497 family protein
VSREGGLKKKAFSHIFICMKFEWDPEKERKNIEAHHVDFTRAQKPFSDPLHFIAKDKKHSRAKNARHEDRYYCVGYDGYGILCVRYTRRNQVTRIFGAEYIDYWRDVYYERNR